MNYTLITIFLFNYPSTTQVCSKDEPKISQKTIVDEKKLTHTTENVIIIQHM